MLLVAMTSASFFERMELVAMKRSTSGLFAGLRFALENFLIDYGIYSQGDVRKV